MNEIFYFISSLNFNWNIVESIAVIFSITYVILASQQNIWCWAFAAISVLLYIYICYNAKLFAETALQCFYLVMAIYGFYSWKKPERNLTINHLENTTHLLIILFGGCLAFLLGFYFTIHTDAKIPILDSFTTIFSIIATYMITQKVLENWLYWIVIDSVSIYLYLNRDLHLTAILFILYTVLAIFGYFSWISKTKIDA